MSLKTFVFGLDNQADSTLIDQLHQNKVLEVKYWIRQEDITPAIKVPHKTYEDFFTRQFADYKRLAPAAFVKKMDKYCFAFLRMNTRHQVNQYNTEPVFARDIEEDYTLFYRWVHFFYGLLTQHQVQLLLHGNVYHEGADFCLNMVARELEIPTLMFYQSLFPNRFCLVKEVADMGDPMGRVPEVSPPLKNSIKKEGNKTQWYMKTIKGPEAHLQEIQEKFNLKKIFNEMRLAILLQLMFGLTDIIESNFHYNPKHLRLPRLRKYLANLKKVSHQNPDFERPFVYFPLHLQPELTTTSLGGKFDDQCCALEKLSSMLPDNVLIYVKENPKQWEAMRGEDFFRRFVHIPKVQMVDISLDSQMLIQKSLFVANITGTAGWEALCLGKPALTFGHAWYNNLPGVFQYNKQSSYEEIVAFKFNADKLQSQYEKLTSHMLEGVLDKSYAAIVPGFNQKDNLDITYQSLLKAINTLEIS